MIKVNKKVNINFLKMIPKKKKNELPHLKRWKIRKKCVYIFRRINRLHLPSWWSLGMKSLFYILPVILKEKKRFNILQK